MSSIQKVNPARTSLYDIIFVHGLDGDGIATWTKAGSLAESWLAWLASDFPQTDVWSLSYDVPAFKSGANTVPLPDRAVNVLELLLSNGVGSRPLIFVCHSYGGLLIKQVLRSALDSGITAKREFVEAVRGVIFLATPHAGSEKASWFISYAKILLPGVAVAELKAHSAQLRDLNLWYRNNARTQGIETAVLSETKSTKGLRIVDETSADPGMEGVIPIPVDSDHVEICKPATKESESYLHVKRFVRAWLSQDLEKAPRNPAVIMRIDWGPSLRSAQETKQAVQRVAAIIFPDGDQQFPQGSRLNGIDAEIFALRKPSVAIRSSIEFMQAWHANVQNGFPDCRIAIGDGHVEDASKWRLQDIVENTIAQLPVGFLYVSEAVVDASDRTMATFSKVTHKGESGGQLFRAEFEDPRTVRDSSLIHAFFVAHPAAQSVRHRLLELFLVEYALEHKQITSLHNVAHWLSQHNYPVISHSLILETLSSSEYFEKAQDVSESAFKLRLEMHAQIAAEQLKYAQSKTECIELVKTALKESTGTEHAVEVADLEALVEEYLSAIFLEIRLMANYLRRTEQVFEGGAQTLAKFDHIINRRLTGLSEGAGSAWRTAFLRGLKRAAESKNTYVAALFHNVLATYYLNRSARSAQYQRDRLRGRKLFIDTNVLYAARVPASGYNDVILYLLAQLTSLGFDLRVFPFSINEYENALRNVDNAFHDGVPEPWVVETNPWIYQEFQMNREVYFTFSACRNVFSIVKSARFSDTDFDRVDAELRPLGLRIERTYESLEPEEISKRWKDLIGMMGTSSLELDRWWNFRYSALQKGDKAVRHDVLCIHNVSVTAQSVGSDEFGPRALFLTLDSEHLLRLSRAFPFIIGVRQCQEYFLPYLFLNDVPIKQSVEFPNQLLSAQLGMLLMKYRPTALEIVESALRSEKPLQALKAESLPSVYRDVASSFNQDRLKDVVAKAKQSPEDASAAAIDIAEVFEFGRKEGLGSEYAIKARDQEISRLRAQLEEAQKTSAKMDEALRKQIRTNRYLRSQSRGKKR